MKALDTSVAVDRRRTRADDLIAPTAQLRDADLVTNVRHFPMLRGLRAAYDVARKS